MHPISHSFGWTTTTEEDAPRLKWPKGRIQTGPNAYHKNWDINKSDYFSDKNFSANS